MHALRLGPGRSAAGGRLRRLVAGLTVERELAYEKHLEALLLDAARPRFARSVFPQPRPEDFPHGPLDCRLTIIRIVRIADSAEHEQPFPNFTDSHAVDNDFGAGHT